MSINLKACLAWTVVVLAISLMMGCTPSVFNRGDESAATAGGAHYRLTKTPDGGCEVIATSSREVGPVSARVDGGSCSLMFEGQNLDAVPMTPEFLRTLLGP